MPDTSAPVNKSAILPAATKGFESIKRFWDPQHNTVHAKILPGECYVSAKSEMIGTVLGSCISACIRDPIAKIGGMNHFMLPIQTGEVGISRNASMDPGLCYGNWAMEYLVNEILKLGGNKKYLEIKVFGGGRVLAGISNIDVGQKNIQFIHEYLEKEGMKIAAEDMGDIYPRKVLYFPETGKVKLKKLKVERSKEVSKQEKDYLQSMSKKPKSNDVELF